MNIEKAIVINKDLAHPVHGDGDFEHQDAIKLGIEALKIVQRIRDKKLVGIWELMPGESKD